MSHLAYLGLGTNLCADANAATRREGLAANLHAALQALQKHVGTLLKCSSFLETAPWGFESENTFLNAAALFKTDLTPRLLLGATREIELAMGRTHKSHNRHYSDRIIDIDILFYDADVVSIPGLTIPHPLIAERAFVLQPLCEIAPDFLHPQQEKTVAQLLAELAAR